MAEQVALWRRWNTAKATSLLSHTKSHAAAAGGAKMARTVALPGDVPIVADAAPAFLEEHIERLLFEGFVLSGSSSQTVPWLRWNLRDILITLLMHYGGLRVSEPMHWELATTVLPELSQGVERVLVVGGSQHRIPKPVLLDLVPRPGAYQSTQHISVLAAIERIAQRSLQRMRQHPELNSELPWRRTYRHYPQLGSRNTEHQSLQAPTLKNWPYSPAHGTY